MRHQTIEKKRANGRAEEMMKNVDCGRSKGVPLVKT